MEATVAASDSEIRELAERILDQSEYARWRFDDEALLEGLRRIMERIGEFLNWLDRLSQQNPMLYLAIMVLMLLVALGLLAHIIWSLRVALRAPAPTGRSVAQPKVHDLRNEAEVLARQGRFLEAARQMQLAAIELLLRRHALELERSDPNQTLRQRLKAAPIPNDQRREILGLLDRLELSWFRDRSNDPQLYQAWTTLHDRLRDFPDMAVPS